MEEKILKKMIAIVDNVMSNFKTDFYKWDLMKLLKYEKTPDFIWSVGKSSTTLFIIDSKIELEKLRQDEMERFRFMSAPNSYINYFLDNGDGNMFYYTDGDLQKVGKGVISSVYGDFIAELKAALNKEFGEAESKFWGKSIPIKCHSFETKRHLDKALQDDISGTLAKILETLSRWQRLGADDEIAIGDDFIDGSFTFCHRRNGVCVMNGGILKYDGRYHLHT